MKFDTELIEGVLLRRYKRFLADVKLDSGEIITAHTPNTGSMTGCCEPGSRVWLKIHDNPKRKYPHSWELVEVSSNTLVGINTGITSGLVDEAIRGGMVPELVGYKLHRREVRYGKENSRIDLLLQGHANRPDCYVEVKNVTLVRQGTAMFPDAVSTRATKHMRELTAMVQRGYRGVIFYCIQRGDVSTMAPADDIDSAYGESLRNAVAAGVEALAFSAMPSPKGIRLSQAIPVVLDRT